MNKFIIFENVFSLAIRQHLYSYFENSFYSLGWSDRNDSIPFSYKYLHSVYSEQDVENLKFFENIQNKKIKKFLKNKKLVKSVVNLVHSNNSFFPHTHANQYSLIYYANIEWRDYWHGETIIYRDDLKDIENCVAFIPNRIVILDKNIPHAIRPPSASCTEYRITFSCFFEDV